MEKEGSGTPDRVQRRGVRVMDQGWKCPNCGKAHAPHVLTCPEPARDKLTPGDWVRQLPGFPVTIGDLPGSMKAGSTRVVDPITGRDLGPSD